MHKYFEDRKARYDAKARDPKLPRPRSPRNTQEKEWVWQEDEMQEMVLRTRPVQQPVVSPDKEHRISGLAKNFTRYRLERN